MNRVIAILVASLLLTTAALKIYGLNETSPASFNLLSDGRVRLATVLWETVLGLWLLSNAKSPLAWLAAQLTFGAFAVVSLTLGFQGAPTCGCLGAVHANPWWMFALDVIVLALLFRFSPPRIAAASAEGTPWKAFLLPVGVAVVPLVVVIGLALSRYGTVEAAVAHARGELVFVRQPRLDFGTSPPNSTHEGVVEIVNYSPSPVRVFGGTVGCGYEILLDCPREVPSGEVGRLRVRVTAPESEGTYRYDATFWVSGYGDSTHPLSVELGGASRIP